MLNKGVRVGSIWKVNFELTPEGEARKLVIRISGRRLPGRVNGMSGIVEEQQRGRRGQSGVRKESRKSVRLGS